MTFFRSFCVHVCCFISIFNAIAQIGPPSVTAGIDKIVYEKGKLDSELISEIIATSQEEVKKELMNRLILRKLECGSFAGWNFTRRSLDVLLTERNPKVITSELLKNVAELGIAVGIAEFYLKDLVKRSQSEKLDDSEKKFLLQYFKFVDGKAQAGATDFIPNKMKDTFSINFSDTTIFRELENSDNYYEILAWYAVFGEGEGLIRNEDGAKQLVKSINTFIDINQHNEKKLLDYNFPKKLTRKFNSFTQTSAEESIDFSGKYLPSIYYLQKFQNRNSDFSEQRASIYSNKLNCFCDGINPNQILIDMVYDVAHNSKEVKDLGLFHNLTIDRHTYESLNKALVLDRVSGANYSIVRPRIEALVKTIFKYYNTLRKEFVDGNSINLQQLKQKAGGDEVKALLATASSRIEELAGEIPLAPSFKTLGYYDDLERLLQKLNQITGREFGEDTDFDDLRYFVHTEIIPEVQKLNIINDQFIDDLYKELKNFEAQVEKKAYAALYDHLKNVKVIPHYKEFIRLLDVLNNVDRVQYKKGVMQQLFSGKLRFKDKNGKPYPKWEEKRLGDVCESIKSGRDKASEDGSFPLYGSTGRIGNSDEYSHDGNYILIARVGANAGTINLVDGKFAASDNTLVVICNDSRSIRYVFYFLSFFNLNKLIFGSGQPLITGGQLKDLMLPIPTIEEQQKIANYLTALDSKIESVGTQIAHTQTFKKGLLQQMFV